MLVNVLPPTGEVEHHSELLFEMHHYFMFTFALVLLLFLQKSNQFIQITELLDSGSLQLKMCPSELLSMADTIVQSCRGITY